jgi:hypothetical protein
LLSQDKVLSSVVQAELTLSTLLNTLSTSLSAQLSPSPPPMVESRPDIKLHLERMNDVLGLLDKTGTVRSRYSR